MLLIDSATEQRRRSSRFAPLVSPLCLAQTLNSKKEFGMCWSETASVSMVAIGSVAVAVTAMRGEPKAIWITIGFFTIMEGLQAIGYTVVDDCSNPANISITSLSYLHIAIQPLFINAFAMAIAPALVPAWQRRWVYGLAGLASAFMLLKMVPLQAFGACTPGSPLCGLQTCLISGDWHIGWVLPLNGFMEGLGPVFTFHIWFPSYFLAVFILPLWYGAWRFAVLHLAIGPVMAAALTTNPSEQPAIWCLFSIGIILISLSPYVRDRIMGAYQRA